MADAYKVVEDITIPRAIREAGEDEILGQQYENEGINYPAGSYVLESQITPTLRESLADDPRLEPVSLDEAHAALAGGDRGVFIPEHETEAQYLSDAGHAVVEKDQVLELRASGSEAAKEAVEAAKSDGRDERPNLTAPEHADLAEVARGEAEPGPVGGSESVEVPEGIEQPPGIPVQANAPEQESGSPRRSRPRRKPQGEDEQQKDEN